MLDRQEASKAHAHRLTTQQAVNLSFPLTVLHLSWLLFPLSPFFSICLFIHFCLCVSISHLSCDTISPLLPPLGHLGFSLYGSFAPSDTCSVCFLSFKQVMKQNSRLFLHPLSLRQPMMEDGFVTTHKSNYADKLTMQ